MLSFKQFLNENAPEFFSHRNTLYYLQDQGAKNRFGRLKTKPQYDPDEDMAIKGFQRGSSALNKSLLGKTNQDLSHLDTRISSAVRKYTTERDMHVYSGFKGDIPSFPTNEEGKHVLKNPAYLSTSLSRRIAMDFGKIQTPSGKYITHVLKIKIPKGSRVGIGQHHAFEDEKELILHKGHTLHIDPKPMIRQSYYDYNKEYKDNLNDSAHWIWNARLVHDGVSE